MRSLKNANLCGASLSLASRVFRLPRNCCATSPPSPVRTSDDGFDKSDGCSLIATTLIALFTMVPRCPRLIRSAIDRRPNNRADKSHGARCVVVAANFNRHRPWRRPAPCGALRVHGTATAARQPGAHGGSAGHGAAARRYSVWRCISARRRGRPGCCAHHRRRGRRQ